MINLLLSTHFYHTHKGGVEIAAHNLALNLIESKKYNITWIAADSDEVPKSNNIKFKALKSTNFVEKYFPFPFPLTLPKGIRTIITEVKFCDILHIHDYLYCSNIIAFIFAKIYKKPIVITQHIGFIPYKNRILRFLLEFVNKYVGIKFLSKANSTVFISHNVMKYFESFARGKNNFQFIPNGIDNKIYNLDLNARESLRQKFSMNTFTILFVGRFTEKKGLNIIHQVAVRLPDCDFWLGGWGILDPEDWNLRNIKVIRGLSGCSIAELYKSADVLLLPSYGEGFPLVVQEAIACGLNVIISDETFQSFRHIEEINPIVIVPEIDNVEEIVSKIKKFKDSYKYRELDSTIRNKFANKYWSFLQITKEYNDIFSKIYPG